MNIFVRTEVFIDMKKAKEYTLEELEKELDEAMDIKPRLRSEQYRVSYLNAYMVIVAGSRSFF